MPSQTVDDQALRELVQRYHDRVYRFGTQVCRDRSDADDVVQEAFITLARRPDVSGSAGVLPWLLTVVRNACVTMLRAVTRSNRRPLSEAVEVADEALTPEAAIERFALVNQVHAAIARLDSESREVIVLRDIEGLSGEETATRLGVSLTAMKSRLHRARNALKEDLLKQR